MQGFAIVQFQHCLCWTNLT